MVEVGDKLGEAVVIGIDESSDARFHKAMEERRKDVGRRAFIADHHHLISPWMYHPAQIRDRDLALMLRMWDRSTS